MRAGKSITAKALLASLLFAAGQAATATTYNWTGGGANSSWATAANWDSNPTVPTFNASADLVWDSDISAAAIKVYSYLGGADGGTRVVQSLTFGDGFDIGAGSATYTLRLRSGSTAGSSTLSFRGVPSITLEENLGLGKDLKTVAIGNNVGAIDLRSNLAVNQNSANVLLSMNADIGQAGGTFAINKTGAGALELYRNGTFGGGVNIDAGTVIVRNAATAAGTGAITLGAAAGADAATLAVGGTPTAPQTFANNIAVNSGDGARTIRNDSSGGIPTLSGDIALGKDVNFDVAIHSGTQNGIIASGAIGGAGGVVKTGEGLLTFSGINTYAGDTTVSLGQLTMADDAGLKFVIGSDGVNNQVKGTGAASLGGDFSFDLTGASTTIGDSWLVVDVDSLSATFESTFSVVDFAVDGGGTLWTAAANGAEYQFSEATGALTVIPEPATLGMLAMVACGLLAVRRVFSA